MLRHHFRQLIGVSPTEYRRMFHTRDARSADEP
jgi:transcriptional regulator GlxA family with amidase domain